jgi:hypothetical protein
MTDRAVVTSPQTYARVAGLLYLIVIVVGIFAEVFVRGQLVVANDAAATAHNYRDARAAISVGFRGRADRHPVQPRWRSSSMSCSRR